VSWHAIINVFLLCAILHQLFLQCQEECNNSSNGWNSVLQSTSLDDRSVLVSWQPNTIDDQYIIEYRLNGSVNYTMSFPVSICIVLHIYHNIKTMVNMTRHHMRGGGGMNYSIIYTRVYIMFLLYNSTEVMMCCSVERISFLTNRSILKTSTMCLQMLKSVPDSTTPI